MNEPKIIVATIGDSCSRTIDMYFRSIQAHVDRIIFIWGNADLKTMGALSLWKQILGDRLTIITRPFDKMDKGENGRARNAYLDILKKEQPGDYALVMDPDEVLQGGEHLRDIVNNCENIRRANDFNEIVGDVHMRHLIGALNQEDATQETHHAPTRWFLITDSLNYPEVEHPVMNVTNNTSVKRVIGKGPVDGVTLWHLAYAGYCFEIKDRYQGHMLKSNMHTPEFLHDWYHAHIFNTYPRRQFDPTELPKEVLEEFMIDPDEFYFKSRTLETKHFIDACYWRDHFKPARVLEVGCGLGSRVAAMRIVGINAAGFDISKYAVKKDIFGLGDNLFQQDLLEVELDGPPMADLVVCYDVLEHIEEKNITRALKIIHSLTSKNVLFSIPFVGDPNLMNDNTHKTFQSREWWERKMMEAGYKIHPTPDHFLFPEQLIVAEAIS